MARALLFIVLFITVQAIGAETLVLSPGHWALQGATGRVPISVSDGAIVHVRDLGAKIKILGRKIGHADIRVGTRSIEVEVISENEYRLFQSLTDTLEGMRGLEITVDGSAPKNSRLRIRGKLLRIQDWLTLEKIARDSRAFYLFEAQIENELAETMRKTLKARLREAFLPDLSIQLVPRAEATLASDTRDLPDLKSRAERVLGPFGFRLSVSAAALSLEPMVRVKLMVAEFKKNLMRKLGVQWPASAEARLLPETSFPGGLLVNVNAVEDSGLGKVLASPTLLCRSGKEAQFLAGGEIPIKIVNFKVQDIVWKKYGVLLKIKPRADHSGRMSIAIETEVSMIDTANAVDGIPGLLTNRIESHFDLASPRTIVLSGLIKKDWGDTTTGLPGLGRLPILGPLFSSRSYRDNQTELVVFVTPEVASLEQEEI